MLTTQTVMVTLYTHIITPHTITITPHTITETVTQNGGEWWAGGEGGRSEVCVVH